MDHADRDDGELDILDLIRFARRNFRFLAVGIALGLLAGLVLGIMRSSSDVVVQSSIALRESQARYIELVRERPSLERIVKASRWNTSHGSVSPRDQMASQAAESFPIGAEALLDLNKRLEIEVLDKTTQKAQPLLEEPDYKIVRISFRAPNEKIGRDVLEQVQTEINRVTNEFIIQTSSKELVVEVEKSTETQQFIDFVMTDEALGKIVEAANLTTDFAVPAAAQAIEILRSRIGYAEKVIEGEVVPDRLVVTIRIDAMNQGARVLKAIEESLPLYERDKFIQNSGEKFAAAVTFFPHVAQDRIAAYVTDTALLSRIARDLGLGEHYSLSTTESAADVLRGRISVISGTEHLRLKGALPTPPASREGQFFQLLVRDRDSAVALNIAKKLMREVQDWVDASDPSNLGAAITRSATVKLADGQAASLIREYIKSPSYIAKLVKRHQLVGHYNRHFGQIDDDEAAARLTHSIVFVHPDLALSIGDGSRQLARLDSLDLPSQKSWVIELKDPDARKAKEVLAAILRDLKGLEPTDVRLALPLAYREKSLILASNMKAADWRAGLVRVQDFPLLGRLIDSGKSSGGTTFETRWYWRRQVLVKDSQGNQRSDYESGVSSFMALPPDAEVTAFEILAPNLSMLQEASSQMSQWAAVLAKASDHDAYQGPVLAPSKRLTPEGLFPATLQVLQGVSVSSASQPLRVLSEPVLFNDFVTQLRMPKILSKKIKAPQHAQIQNATVVASPGVDAEGTAKLNKIVRLFVPLGGLLGGLLAVFTAIIVELLRRDKQLTAMAASDASVQKGGGSSGPGAPPSASAKDSADGRSGAWPGPAFAPRLQTLQSQSPDQARAPAEHFVTALPHRPRRGPRMPNVYHQSAHVRPRPSFGRYRSLRQTPQGLPSSRDRNSKSLT